MVDKLIKRKEAAEMLGISLDTLDHARMEGLILTFSMLRMAVFILLKLDFRSILQGLHIVQGRRITIRLSERREQPGAKFDIVEYWQVIRNNEYIS